MKALSNTVKVSKGDRLKWAPKEDAQSVKLSIRLKPKKLTEKDLAKVRQSQPAKFLVP
jgi:hypothetical protein